MRYILAIIAGLVLAFMLTCYGNPPAYGQTVRPACTKPTPTPTPTPAPTPTSTVTNQNINTNTNTNNSTSSSSSTASQQQSQSQLQNQTATGGSASSTATGGSASNGAQSNSQTSVTNYQRQAPTAIAPEAFSTAPCRIAGSVGASAPLGGVSVGGSKKDKECDQFHLAAYFSSIGRNDLAIQVLCSMKAAKGVKNCKELPPPPSPSLPTVVLPPPPAPLPIVIVVPVTVPAPPEYRTEITVVAPKAKPTTKKALHHMPPNCQNVVQRVCK